MPQLTDIELSEWIHVGGTPETELWLRPLDQPDPHRPFEVFVRISEGIAAQHETAGHMFEPITDWIGRLRDNLQEPVACGAWEDSYRSLQLTPTGTRLGSVVLDVVVERHGVWKLSFSMILEPAQLDRCIPLLRRAWIE